MVEIEELRVIGAFGQICVVSEIFVYRTVIYVAVGVGKPDSHFVVAYRAQGGNVSARHITYPVLVKLGVAAGIIGFVVLISLGNVDGTAYRH